MKYFHLPFLVLVFLLTGMLYAQPTFQWGVAAGSTQRDEVTDLVLTPSNEVLVTGVFEDSIDLEDGPGESFIKGRGFKDIFLAKYDAQGAYKWGFSLGNVGWDRGWSLATDPQGAAYIGGVFTRRVDFDPGPDSTVLQSNSAGFWPDGYLAKYDTDGELVWAKHLLTARDRSASQSATLLSIRSIEIDVNGDLIVGGAYWDSVWFAPNVLEVSQTALRDMFLAKYDGENGDLIWVKTFGAAADQEIRGVYPDAQGNIYTTGYFFGSPDFDPGVGTTTFTSAGGGDIFLAKYNSNGELLWAHGFGSADNVLVRPEGGNDLGVDAAGNAYITGVFYGSIDFDPGPGTMMLAPDQASVDHFTAKYTPNGELEWVFSLRRASYEVGKSISVQDDGSFFLGGDFSSTSLGMDLDPDPIDSAMVFSLSGTRDIFFAKYTTDMDFLYGQSFRGLEEDELLAIDGNGDELAAGGLFFRTILFDPTMGDLRFSKGNADIFFFRMGSGTISILESLDGNAIGIFPNPATEWIGIQWPEPGPRSGILNISTLHGKSVYTERLSGTLSEKIIPVAHLPAGMYVLEYREAKVRYSHKVVIQ
ncbi:MAG: T9SS type A sorting domain-containing protein [Bacteroidota bacterium]